MEVINDFAGSLAWREGAELPATSKEDCQQHGLGLLNIARCAEKSKGTVDIETVEKDGQQKFCLTVMLYQRKS